MLYVSRESSFISAQFFFQNFVGWFVVLSQKFIIFWYSIVALLYLSQIINNFLSFFWRYISFFSYFFIMFICNCFWINFFLQSFWDFWDLQILLGQLNSTSFLYFTLQLTNKVMLILSPYFKWFRTLVNKSYFNV